MNLRGVIAKKKKFFIFLFLFFHGILVVAQKQKEISKIVYCEEYHPPKICNLNGSFVKV